MLPDLDDFRNHLSSISLWVGLLFSFSIFANEHPIEMNELPAIPEGNLSFFQVDLKTDWVSSRKMDTTESAQGSIGYGESDVGLRYFFPIESGYLFTGIGYQRTHLKWNENPFFDKSWFQNGYASFGGQLKRERFSFQGEASINTDLDLPFDKSLLYLFGGSTTYMINPSFSLAGGLLARTGLGKTEFWPIFGFDWRVSDEWAVHAIYPTNLALVYRLDDQFDLSLVTRFLNSRHRASDGSNDSLKPTFQYENVGEEIALNYNWGLLLSANIHVGWMSKAILEIENGLSSRLKTGGSYYVGGSFFIRF